MNEVKMSTGDKVFYTGVIAFLAIVAVIMLVPLLNVISISFSKPLAVDSGRVFIWPVDFTLAAWEQILGRADIWRSAVVTFAVTVGRTALSLIFTALMAYPMAKKEFKLAKALGLMVAITMVFRYPLIPYFLSVRNYGLYNNILAIIIPHTIVAYNLIILRSFFKELPEEMEESAKIEGCNYFQILFKIVLPMSKPALASIGLFYAVMYWNQFLHPLLFIENKNLMTLQMKIREFISSEDTAITQMVSNPNYDINTLRSATIIFAIVPIMAVYPFLQKYFVKGANLGAVKG